VREQIKYGIAIFVGAVVGVAALTNQSFWIDEGSAALKAIQPSLRNWWQALHVEKDSNLQLICQLFYLWGWEKIFGPSEYALRASNVPWFAAGTAAMAWAFPRRTLLQLSVLLLTLTNAFLCYYLSEARPYIVLFAFSAITAACLVRLVLDESVSNPGTWFRLFCIGIIGLCVTSLIAVPWAMGAVFAVTMWLGTHRTWQTLRKFPFTTAVTALLLIASALYYFWTLQVGAHASDVGRTGWKSVAFILYELSGLSGLGPSRLTLRAPVFQVYRPFVLPLVVGETAVVALIFAAGSALAANMDRRRLNFFALAAGLPFVLVLAAGYVAHMRLLGRHLMPLLPFVLAIFAVGLHRFLTAPQILARWAGWLIIAILAVSAFEIRFAPRHRRDDYRAAATFVRAPADAGQRIWWVADENTGRYYKVPLGSKNVLSILQINQIGLEQAEPPDLVVLSKPDIYDPNGQIAAYLTRHNFKVVAEPIAFRVWRKPARSLPR
jgi:hypothetical protein